MCFVKTPSIIFPTLGAFIDIVNINEGTSVGFLALRAFPMCDQAVDQTNKIKLLLQFQINNISKPLLLADTVYLMLFVLYIVLERKYLPGTGKSSGCNSM